MKVQFGFLISIIVILGGVYFFFQYSKSHSPIVTRKAGITSQQLPKETTIILGKNGFSPKEITIAMGTAVRWKNSSGKPQTVNSDNYPTNQLHKELNFGVFGNNSSVVYVFTKPGTYAYHNQFHPEQRGEIQVTR